MNKHFDVLVLGAGIVGISTALHLQKRGLSVALVDRRRPGQETSYGNAGFIESSAILPHPFPRGLGNLLTFAGNRSNAVRVDYRHLTRIAPWLLSYRLASGERRLKEIGPAFRALISEALTEHRALMAEAQALDLLREHGWLELCRSDDELRRADGDAEAARSLGIPAWKLDRNALRDREPALTAQFAGAIHWAGTQRIVDPGGLMERLAALFVARQGRILRGDAMALEQDGPGWRLPFPGAPAVRAKHSVIALGPWSGDLARKLGYRLPLAVKRGYHREFRDAGSPPLRHPVFVRDRSCLIVPMERGIRVLSGIELAPRDASPNPHQIDRMVRCARETLALGAPLADEPWLGARPCLPDMLPAIGKADGHQGLWFACGHGHYGLTLGPLTGRMIADLMTSGRTIVPADPYAPGRFERVWPMQRAVRMPEQKEGKTWITKMQ